MEDKKANPIVYSIVGWFVFFGGIAQIRLAPVTIRYGFLINIAIFMCYIIIAFILLTISVVRTFKHTVKYKRHIISCVLSIVSLAGFIIFLYMAISRCWIFEWIP